jgi:predicted DCC family thiol-disulfide oxidoreductase YuxK
LTAKVRPSTDLRERAMFVNLMELKTGQRILLKSQAVAEVTENLGDGIWVKGRFIEFPGDPAAVGSEDLCYCEDVLKVLEAA